MDMLERGKITRDAVELINTEAFVPKDHLLRKIDKTVDFSKIYGFVEDLYCGDNGRRSVDPVVLIKMALIKHLYGLVSLRRTTSEINMNVAYRWFLGYTMNEQIPHFSTISYNFKHRFTPETVEKIFTWILSEANEAGCIEPEAVFIDGTHIKASANFKKRIKEQIPEAAKIYSEQLMKEINDDREKHGKKLFDDDDDEPKPPKTREVTKSTTDPESGVFHKGEHKDCFAYEAHTACDRHGFILGVEVTPGNMHDSIAFDKVYEQVTALYPEVKVIVADAAYKTPWICKRIIDDKRVPSMPYIQPKTADGNHEWWKYVYDEYYDCIICPEYKVLHYATTNRDGYREYKSRSYICENCPSRERCTANKDCTKTVLRHIWYDYIELAEDARHTSEYKDLYELRKETIERCFADAKEKHAMRYTTYRGLTQVANWVKLKYAFMNLKKLAKWKWSSSLSRFIFGLVTVSNIENMKNRCFA
jgi:transposase